MNLYSITDEIKSLLGQAIDVNTGEILDDALAKLLDEREGERDQRVLDIACAVLDYDADGEKIEKRARELIEWARRHYAKAESLRRYISRCIPEGHKVADDRVRVSWRKSERVTLDVIVDALPDEYVRVKREAALGELGVALKSGDAEAARFAHLETRHSLQVK